MNLWSTLMARFRRLIRRNHGTECPSQCVFVDTESWRLPHESKPSVETLSLRLWCASRVRLDRSIPSRRKEATGKSGDEFWAWLDGVTDTKRCTWIFGHNLAHDLTQLGFWEKLDAGHFTIDPKYKKGYDPDSPNAVSWRGRLVIDGRPFFAVVRRGDKHYKLVDTGNYTPLSLEDIGKAVGLDKYEMPDQNRPDGEWEMYCRRDVDITERYAINLMQTWRKENCGVFQMTAAALAMTNYRHFADTSVIDDDCIDIEAKPGDWTNDLERAAYFGGRVQPFFVGELMHTLYHLDINSLYPYMMQEHLFPRRFVRYTDGESPASVLANLQAYGGVAEVYCNARHNDFPVRINGKGYHCTGQYWAVLCGPELRRALETQSVVRVGRVQYYSIAPIFTRWVHYWYSRKLAAARAGIEGAAEYEFAKLVLNSLSGKWAQKGRYWEERYDKVALRRWGGWPEQETLDGPWKKFRGIAGKTQELTEENEPPHAFPAISAFITSHAREQMRMLIELCPDGSVYYMATDGIICNKDAYDALLENGWIDNEKIGHFKVKGVYRDGEICGANHYRLGDLVIRGGFSGAAQVSTKGESTCEIWDRMPVIINGGPRTTINITKFQSRPVEHDHKGVIGMDGRWVPYRLSFDPDFSDRVRSRGYELGEHWTRLFAS